MATPHMIAARIAILLVLRRHLAKEKNQKTKYAVDINIGLQLTLKQYKIKICLHKSKEKHQQRERILNYKERKTKEVILVSVIKS